MSSKPNNTEKGTNSNALFTVDNTRTSIIEMPSVTKLLNRRSLTKVHIAKDTPPVFDAPPEVPENEIQLVSSLEFHEERPGEIAVADPAAIAPVELDRPPPLVLPSEQAQGSPASGEASSKVTVRPAMRKRKPLYLWTKNILAEAQDPFHHGVYYLIEKGAQAAALLSPTKGAQAALIAEQGSSCTPFTTSYAYVERERAEIWRGLTLSEDLLPDVWKTLIEQGYAEFAPQQNDNVTRVGQSMEPPTSPQGESSAALLRKTFNLSHKDWFTLVRCGSPEECTGILALVSSRSVLVHLVKAFSAGQKAA